MQHCTRCGEVSPDDALSCQRCGHPFDRGIQQKKQRSFLAGLLSLLGIRRNPQKGILGCAPLPTISVALIAVIIIGIMVGPVLKLIPPFAPGLTINGTVVPGGTVVVHGTNFPAGNRINLALDGVSIAHALNSRHFKPHSLYEISLSAVQVSTFQQTEQPSISAGNITVKSDGTFDVQISIPKSWQLNSQHIIQAQVIGQDGGVQTQVQQTVTIQNQIVILTNTTSRTPSVPGGTATATTSASACSSSAGPGTNLTFSFSGAAPSPMCVVRNGGCHINTASGTYEFEVTGTVNGSSYTFQIITAAYQGPGSYTTMTVVLTPGNSLKDNQGWVTQTETITVNSDGQSGSVNALLNNNINTSGTVDVNGNWACS